MSKRRDIIKGGSLATIWLAPVVQTVVLPAHAQTSNPVAPEPEPDPDLDVGNIKKVQAFIRFPGANGVDHNGDGILDATDEFEIDAILMTGQKPSKGVELGNTITITGPATQVGGIGENVGNVPPNTTVSTNTSSDACILVNFLAMVGDLIFVDFTITADGVTRTFRAGPFEVGEPLPIGLIDVMPL